MKQELPPHSIPDERGVISCVLQDADQCLPDCAKLAVESFYDALCQATWSAITTLANSNSRVNSIAVIRWLKQNEKIEGIDDKINQLENEAPSASNLPYYLPTVQDLALRRKIIRGCAKLSAMAMNGHTTPQIMAFADRIAAVEMPNSSPVLDGTQAGEKLINDLERRHKLAGQLPGLDTGLEVINENLDGLQYGEQTIVGARPSAGKTAFGLTIFQHVAFKLNIPALFVSLEMSAEALMRRMMSSDIKLDMRSIRRGNYSDKNFTQFVSFVGKSKRAPMFILDGARGMAIGEITASVRRHCRKHKIQLVVIDYLQKIQRAEKQEKRTYEVGDVSQKLKHLAVDTGAAFLTLAQLNRESDKDKPRPPRITDLADSAQIERDADTILLIDRRGESDDAGIVIAKQRDGATDIVRLHFNGPLCRFENASSVTHEDQPEARYPND